MVNQGGDSSILQPEKLKLQPTVNFYPKKITICYSMFKIESKTASKDDEQRNSVDEEIKAETKEN